MNMKSALSAIVAALTPAPSVAAITRDLVHSQNRLRAAQSNLNARAELAEKRAAKLVQRAVQNRAEANRSGRVQARLSDLLR